jgi:hypothetical protein
VHFTFYQLFYQLFVPLEIQTYIPQPVMRQPGGYAPDKLTEQHSRDNFQRRKTDDD